MCSFLSEVLLEAGKSGLLQARRAGPRAGRGWGLCPTRCQCPASRGLHIPTQKALGAGGDTAEADRRKHARALLREPRPSVAGPRSLGLTGCPPFRPVPEARTCATGGADVAWRRGGVALRSRGRGLWRGRLRKPWRGRGLAGLENHTYV